MCAAACFPIATHSPRVEPGLSLEATYILPASRSRRPPIGLSPFAVPPEAIQLVGSLRDSATDFGFRFATGLSIFQLDVDAYVQLPRWALLGLDGGVGATALAPSFGSDAPMPYAELGFVRSHRGPYVVAGYIHQSIDTLTAPMSWQLPRVDAWEATFAYQFGSDKGGFRPFVTTVIGHKYALRCEGKGSDCSTYPRARALFVGVDVESLRRP